MSHLGLTSHLGIYSIQRNTARIGPRGVLPAERSEGMEKEEC